MTAADLLTEALCDGDMHATDQVCREWYTVADIEGRAS